MTLLHFPSGSTAGNTGLLKWSDMAVVPPSGQPGRAKIRPLSLWLPHNSNRLFIEQRRQVGRKVGGWVGVWGSQAANIDKERGRDTVTHSRGTCTDRNIWVIISHSGQTLSRKRDGWQRFSSRILCFRDVGACVISLCASVRTCTTMVSLHDSEQPEAPSLCCLIVAWQHSEIQARNI